MSRLHPILLAAALSLPTGAALALTSQEVIDDLSAQGYTRIEVKVGPTQIKVEAIRGTEELEQVFDSATGNVLKSEVDRVDADDNVTPGVTVRNRNRDFVGARGDDDDDRDDDRDDDDDDRDGDDDDHGHDDDDHDDDHGGNSGHGGGDDDGDDD
jgi:hypothetical protein